MSRFIEIDDNAPAAPAAAPTTITVDGTTSTIVQTPGTAETGQVSKYARDRILRQQAALENVGVTGTKLAGEGGITAWSGLAIGTRVRADGDKRLAKFRSSWEKKPLAVDGLETLRDAVRAEGREQVEGVKLSTLLCRYNPAKVAEQGPQAVDGALAVKNGKWHTIAPTPTALKHLGQFLTDDKGAATYLANAPARVRAAMVEEYRPAIDPTKTVTLGLKRNVASELPGATTCYRVTSPDYTSYEVDRGADDLLADPEVRDALRDARVEIDYDGERAKIRVVWHADTVVDLAAGDVFKVGAVFTLDDVRGGSVKVDAAAWRNACLNLIIIGKQSKNLMRQRHVGEVGNIAQQFVAAAKQVRGLFEQEFIAPWSAARQDRIIDTLGGDPRKVFAGLVGAGLVNLPGRVEQQVEALMDAWNAEPGYTKADVLNAVTRAAHTSWWTTAGAEEDVEAQAGQLLYVRNLNARIEAGASTVASKFNVEW